MTNIFVSILSFVYVLLICFPMSSQGPLFMAQSIWDLMKVSSLSFSSVMRLVAAQDTGLSTLLTPCTTVSNSPGSFLGGGGGGGLLCWGGGGPRRCGGGTPPGRGWGTSTGARGGPRCCGGGGGGATPTLLLYGLGCLGSAGLGWYLAWSPAPSCCSWGPGAEFPLMTASQASSSARGSAEAEQRAARGSSTEIPAGEGEVNNGSNIIHGDEN